MKYSIKTYGCKLNQSETSDLRRVLSTKFTEAPDSEADLIVINSCGVIDKTERRVLKKAKEFKKKGKTVVITGCLPSMTKKVKKVADLTLQGNDPEDFLRKISSIQEMGSLEDDGIPSLRKKGSVSAIIPISTGCLGNCSYCSAKIARGELVSYPVEKIKREVIRNLDRGAKEIQITSQDLSVYGMDTGKPLLVDLIREIINIERDFKVKLGMMNPGFVDGYFDLFLELFKSDKLYNFLHIPVQSGSDEILKKMNRRHNSGDFVKLIEKIRGRYKNFLISTDVIVGFPTESEDDFEETVDLIKKTRPHIINITRYSQRSGTEADQMKDMPSKIKKRRSRRLTKLGKEMRREDNQKMVGEEFETLIFREGKGETKLGRIFNGKAVVIPEGGPGEKKKVKIVDFKHNYLIGDVKS